VKDSLPIWIICGEVEQIPEQHLVERPSPRCGRREGKFKDGGSGRFRYLLIYGACAWSAGPARIKDVAVKLWNEAKPARAAGE
jgi:hypothetical protein